MTLCFQGRRRRMKEDVKERLLQGLKELHLPVCRHSYEELARQAQQEGHSYEQYLLGLVERECQERRNNRIERLLRQSRLPLEKSWQALELKRLPTKVLQQARTLLEGSFVDRRENALVFGVPGSGKTHLLCAIGQELIRSGRKVLFWTTGLLVQELLVAKRDLKLSGGLSASGGLGGTDPGRPGLCPAEPGGDGGAVHAAGGAVRARERVADEQPAVLGLGSDLQGSDDDGGGHRPPVHHSVIIELNLSSYRAEQAKKAKQH